MDPAELVLALLQAAVQIPEPHADLPEQEKDFARELLARFEEAEATHGPLPRGDMLRAMLLSKNGRYQDALAFSLRRYEESPNWHTAAAAGNAARRAGDLDLAAAMFAKGTAHDPEDLSCFLEIGDIRVAQSRWHEALSAYDTVLAKEPRHQWALPSAFFCRHRLGIEGAWLASLVEFANQEACTCGLGGCLQSLFGAHGAARGRRRAAQLLRDIREDT